MFPKQSIHETITVFQPSPFILEREMTNPFKTKPTRLKNPLNKQVVISKTKEQKKGILERLVSDAGLSRYFFDRLLESESEIKSYRELMTSEGALVNQQGALLLSCLLSKELLSVYGLYFRLTPKIDDSGIIRYEIIASQTNRHRYSAMEHRYINNALLVRPSESTSMATYYARADLETIYLADNTGILGTEMYLKRVKILGVKQRNQKAPVVIECCNGKQYKVTWETTRWIVGSTVFHRAPVNFVSE